MVSTSGSDQSGSGVYIKIRSEIEDVVSTSGSDRADVVSTSGSDQSGRVVTHDQIRAVCNED